MSLLAKLSARTHPAAVSSDQQQPDLEQLMVDLARYGKPRLSMVRPGLWHASIEMNTSAVGASFDVKAEFDHATPVEAVTTLAQRMHAALARMGVKP